MASTKPVLLILGAGANVGAGVARAFAAKGYRVAVSSRSAVKEGSEGHDLQIQSDLSDPHAVNSIFQKVTAALGAPSVVVYNAAAATTASPTDPLSLPVSELERDLKINTLSVLAAAHEATAAFEALPSSASRTFIYTGNRLNIGPIPALLSLGMGKSASAHLISAAAMAYKDRGFKFFYADERKTEGGPAFQISGEAHGEFFVQLAEGTSDIPWLATFVKGKGYVDFGRKLDVN